MKTISFKTGSFLVLATVAFITVVALLVFARMTPDEVDLKDVDLAPQVKRFLESHAWGGRGAANVPAVDGLTLHDIVLEKGYTRALEIGTSTGHSTVWIASALKRTGGSLITIEIDEGRHRQAVENLKAAGLSDLVDTRLGNAHEIVPTLEGPFDFVFSDADKGWYENYLNTLLPKLEVGGCYTTHNVSLPGRFSGWFSESGDYMEYLLGLPNLKTTVDDRGRGLSVSYKVSE